MIDKFQKLFGPNPPRSTSAGTQQLGYGATGEDDVHRRQVSRLRNKRRFLGIMVLVVAAAVIAPSVFEPNDYYANRGAKLEIPALQSGAPAKVVSLAPEAQKPLPEAVVVPKAPSSAAALSAANTVNAGARPALEAPQPLEATGAQGTAAAQVVKNVAEQKVEKAAKAAAVAAAAKNAKDAGAGKQSTSTSAKPQGQTNTASAKSEEPVAAPSAPASTGPIRAVANGTYFIQVIATSNRNSAQKQAQKLRALGLPAYTEIVHRRGTDLWRVRVGHFASEQEARRALDILALNAIENGGVNQEPHAKSN